MQLAYFTRSCFCFFFHIHVSRSIVHRKLRVSTEFGDKTLLRQHLTFTRDIVTFRIVYVNEALTIPNSELYHKIKRLLTFFCSIDIHLSCANAQRALSYVVMSITASYSHIRVRLKRVKMCTEVKVATFHGLENPVSFDIIGLSDHQKKHRDQSILVVLLHPEDVEQPQTPLDG